MKDLDEMDNKINELKSHLSERKESLKKVMTGTPFMLDNSNAQ